MNCSINLNYFNVNYYRNSYNYLDIDLNAFYELISQLHFYEVVLINKKVMHRTFLICIDLNFSMHVGNCDLILL